MKKLLSSIIVFVLCAGMFTGCGSKGDNQNAAPTSGTAEAEKPLKFTMSMTDNLNKYLLQSQDINKDKWIQEINKRANVEMKITFLNNAKFADQMQLMFASGDIPDVVWSFGVWDSIYVSSAIKAGVFMPLDDLLKKNKDNLKNMMSAVPEQAWKESKNTEGVTYGVPTSFLGVAGTRGTFIRKDLLDKYSLKVPKTVDEFIEVMRVFKKNGMKYPYLGREKWAYTEMFMNAYGVSPTRWNLNDKGEMVPDIIRPEFKETLALHSKLREEGLMNPESLTTNGTVWNDKIKAGEVGIFMHNASGLAGWNTALSKNVPGGEFMLIPSPVGPKGIGGSTISPTAMQSMFINSKFKEPERFLKFLDFMASPKMQEFMAYGTDDKSQYKIPTEELAVSEEGFRALLRFMQDSSHNKYTLPLQQDGDKVLKWFQDIGPKEGYHAYTEPALKAFDAHPDLRPLNCDLFYEYAAKIFLGQLPASSYDDFIKEYLKRGGSEFVKEATDLYKAGKMNKY